MIPFLHTFESLSSAFTDKTGVRFNPWPLFVTGLSLLMLAFVFMPFVVSFAFSLALFLAPLWLPAMLVGGAWVLWIVLRRSEFIAAQKTILLEIRPPRGLVKTPLAMEAFLAGIHLSPSESNWFVRFIQGGVRPWWSLEMASLEGQIHFYIWTRANFRRIIEGQLYAQYPGAQLVEAVDYTRTIPVTDKDWKIWGCDYKHTAKDPLPIKTYVEYGLDKVQKEPEQVDPMANLIEFMGSIGKGEYLWLQFVIRVHKGEKYGSALGGNESTRLNKEGKPYTWIDEGREIVDDIRKKTRESYVDSITGEERPGFPNPTKGQSEMIAAIERNTSKLAFDVGIRAVYIAKPEKFHTIIINHMIGLFKPFNTMGWNGLNSDAWLKRFNDYPWEIWQELVKGRYREELVEAYRRRQFFHDPFGNGIKKEEIPVMSTEEIATLYHIPSASIQTPGLARIQSATREAPSDLPT